MCLTSDIDEVVFVNVVVPQPWESATNTVFLDAGSETAAGLFRSDGYRLTTEGIDAWVGMIMAEVTD